MATNLKVQGNHIQYILDNILGFEIGAGFTGNKGKQDEYKTYILSEGAITTNDDERINIHYYWDYRLTVKSNLFTFPIVGRFDVNHVMKVLTDEQQTRILTYLGCDITSDEEEAEPEWNPNGIEIKDDDSGLCNVCNKWQPICKFQEDDIIKQPCKDCFCDDITSDEEVEDAKHREEFPDHERCDECDCCIGCGCCECEKEEETKYTCEECGTHDEDEVGISTGANGIEKRVCECCDIDGSNYSGWGDEITSDK